MRDEELLCKYLPHTLLSVTRGISSLNDMIALDSDDRRNPFK